MSETEQLAQFQSVMLQTLTIVREMRKDIWKLQINCLPLRNSLAALDPTSDKHFQDVRDAVETSLAAQRPDADKQFDKLLDEAIGIFGINQKKIEN